MLLWGLIFPSFCHPNLTFSILLPSLHSYHPFVIWSYLPIFFLSYQNPSSIDKRGKSCYILGNFYMFSWIENILGLIVLVFWTLEAGIHFSTHLGTNQNSSQCNQRNLRGNGRVFQWEYLFSSCPIFW